MLQLSREQLIAASEWLPIEPGYGRDEAKPIVDGLRPIVNALRGRHWLGVEVESEGGMENFAHIFIYDSQVYPRFEEDQQRKTQRYQGTSIYLSLLGPYAAIGPSERFMSYDKQPVGNVLGAGFAPAISLAQVLEQAFNDDTVAQAALNEVRANGFRVLSRKELSVELPIDIEPMDPSGLGPPPYTLFNLLFNCTD